VFTLDTYTLTSYCEGLRDVNEYKVKLDHSHTAKDFATFVAKKVDTIRAATAGRPTPPPAADAAHCSWSTFRQLSKAEVRGLIMSSPMKSCTLDLVPTFLMKEFVDVLLPYVTVTNMVNASLSQGRLPDSQKHALVTPLLKRGPVLDTADMANYRPVSNVTFMSKIVERAVAKQLRSPVSGGQWAITASPVCLSPTSFDRNSHLTCRLRCPDRFRRTTSVNDVASWMRSNRLQLNTAKTEVLWCATSRRQHQIPQEATRVGNDFVQTAGWVRNLGIYLDSEASMKIHVFRSV